jgi:hypothetical protein
MEGKQAHVCLSEGDSKKGEGGGGGPTRREWGARGSTATAATPQRQRTRRTMPWMYFGAVFKMWATRSRAKDLSG